MGCIMIVGGASIVLHHLVALCFTENRQIPSKPLKTGIDPDGGGGDMAILKLFWALYG